MFPSRRLNTIPIANLPPSSGGKIKHITPEEFYKQFGYVYDEKIEEGSQPLSFEHFKESIEGRLPSSQLIRQLQHLIDNPREDLILAKINDSVGYGVFAANDIPENSVLCFFSGTVTSGTTMLERDNEGTAIHGMSAFMSTKGHRGISSYFQHLPSVPPIPDINFFLHILHKTGQHVSEKELRLNDELFSIDFLDKDTRLSLATANVRREYVLYKGIPVILYVTNQPIKAHEQLGLKYGYHYWSSRDIVPELFDKAGKTIPYTQYRRTFWQLTFEGFCYEGDLRPLVAQIKSKKTKVEFEDEKNTKHVLDSDVVARELIRVHAMTQAEFNAVLISQSSTTSRSTFFNGAAKQTLLKKYNLPDDSKLSLEKGLRNAATNNLLEDLKLFLAYGADIDAADANPASKRTALMHAARKGHDGCYQFLLEQGADPHIQDAAGYVAADIYSVILRLSKPAA